MGDADVKQMGQGPYWQELVVGDRFRTFRRTVTETDLVNFISCTGMLEVLSSMKPMKGGRRWTDRPGGSDLRTH